MAANKPVLSNKKWRENKCLAPFLYSEQLNVRVQGFHTPFNHCFGIGCPRVAVRRAMNADDLINCPHVVVSRAIDT